MNKTILMLFSLVSLASFAGALEDEVRLRAELPRLKDASAAHYLLYVDHGKVPQSAAFRYEIIPSVK